MLLLMLEAGMPIDRVITADTGMEFPEMYRQWDRMDQLLYQERGIHLTILRHPKGFEWLMFDEPKEKPKTLATREALSVTPYGNGWPGIRVRWCTGQLKTHLIQQEVRRIKGAYNALHYIGIAADEPKRIKNEVYPLVQWGITEAEALQICYNRGFDWNGLYEIYHRCSCWCCPFQRIDELRKLRRHHPELWARLRDMDERAIGQFGHTALGRFKDNWTVEQLERRFAAEDAAMKAEGKEDMMDKDNAEEIRDLIKGVPPENVVLQVDDLPPKTLAQHMEQQKTQKKGRQQKPGSSR
jgi:3'-phosphoadenosine 5'-phosphosulfate sulfotransferase (PAPS reductase)/FAD synthetase